MSNLETTARVDAALAEPGPEVTTSVPSPAASTNRVNVVSSGDPTEIR